jgi:FtsP/CotA-like multicopper oxidase with cupredoxin domain
MIAFPLPALPFRSGRALLCAALAIGLAASSRPATASPLQLIDTSLPRVEANDNRTPAGHVDRGMATLALRAAIGRWQPEGPDGPSLEIEAFGEVDGALMVPAPLIRVAEGTTIVVSVRNDLTAPLAIHGLCSRGDASCPIVEVAPRETRTMQFTSGPAGTYHYWASSFGAPVPFREMAGAFVVDPVSGATPDRILVITEWSDLTVAQLRDIVTADDGTEKFVSFNPRLMFVINGLSWPATERFSYERGDTVRWRVINLSSQAHPMHLHGFYFDVDSLGDGMRESPVADSQPRRVVTQLMPSGGTMRMTWVPERAGNWLFHCHIMLHVSTARRLDSDRSTHTHDDHHSQHGDDAALGMAGMVIGVTVREPAAAIAPSHQHAGAARRLTLTLQPTAGQRTDVPGAGFVLTEGDVAVTAARGSAPGPAIVLRRNEPVEITLVNQLAEATAIHWHGIELESYYDGVHGFSGAGAHVTPMIEAGGRFVVRFTPPRAGTFIYHTHLHDYRQLSSGLYGPIVVMGEGESFDPTTDHVVVVGRTGLTSAAPSVLSEPDSVVINGERAPRFVWKAGVRHRVRVINITPDDIFSVTLQTADGPSTWRRVAKDGWPLTPTSASVPARQVIAVGETYDFEYEAPRGRSTAWLEVRTPGGKWQAQGQVIIK